MFAVTVTFRVKKEFAEQFAENVIRQASNSLMNEENCHQFDVCMDPSDPQRVFLYEIYTDSAAFDAHRKTAHFKDFNSTVTTWLQEKEVRTWDRHEG